MPETSRRPVDKSPQDALSLDPAVHCPDTNADKTSDGPAYRVGSTALASAAVRVCRDRMTWWVIAFAVSLRLALWVASYGHPERRYWEDGLDYSALARTMYSSGEFAQKPNGDPELGRLPGYPAFLMPFVASLDEPANCVALVQILMDTLTVLLLMLFCARRLPRFNVLVAGCLYAACLATIVAANVILSETLFILVIISLLLTADTLPYTNGTRRHGLTGLAGFLLGASVLVRMVALPLILPLVVWAAWKGPWRARTAALLCCLCGFALPIGGWMVRNHAVSGSWCVSTTSDLMLLQGNVALFQASITKQPLATVKADLLKEADARALATGDPSQATVSRMRREVAIEIIRRHPARAVMYFLHRNACNLLPDHQYLLRLIGISDYSRSGTLDTLRRKGLCAGLCQWFGLKDPTTGNLVWALVLAAPFGFLLTATYLLALMGSATLLRSKMVAFLLLVSVPIACLLIAPGGAIDPRYRAPAMPFICILAACSRWPWFRRRQEVACCRPKAQTGGTWRH